MGQNAKFIALSAAVGLALAAIVLLAYAYLRWL